MLLATIGIKRGVRYGDWQEEHHFHSGDGRGARMPETNATQRVPRAVYERLVDAGLLPLSARVEVVDE